MASLCLHRTATPLEEQRGLGCQLVQQAQCLSPNPTTRGNEIEVVIIITRATEKAQGLRAHTALPEDLTLDPGTQLGIHSCLDLQTQGIRCLLLCFAAPALTCTFPHRDTCGHTIKKINLGGLERWLSDLEHFTTLSGLEFNSQQKHGGSQPSVMGSDSFFCCIHKVHE